MLNFYCFSRTRRYIDGDRNCHLSARMFDKTPDSEKFPNLHPLGALNRANTVVRCPMPVLFHSQWFLDSCFPCPVFFSSVVWCIYGYLKMDSTLIFVNFVGILSNLAVVGVCYSYTVQKVNCVIDVYSGTNILFKTNLPCWASG